jgi:hypothetical protein
MRSEPRNRKMMMMTISRVSRAPVVVGPLGDHVAQLRQRGAGLGGDAGLDVETAGRVRVRPEGIGEAARGQPRGLHRLLGRHAVRNHVQQYLQQGLLLHVAARSAEGHEGAAVAQHERRRGGEPRPLAARDLAGMAGHEPAL